MSAPPLPATLALALLQELRSPGSSGVFYALAILLTLLIASLVAFIWAAFFRKRHHRHHHRRRHGRTTPALPPAVIQRTAPSTHRRHRRHHESDLPRNPTLAETGGLPPIHGHPSEPPLAST